jgi:hypothetical protein
VRRVALEVKALLDELGLLGWPKTSGSRGIPRARADPPRWSFDDVRRAALALSREIERRAPTLATSKWWKEERHGVFLDYNQNAKDRTTCSAWSVRPLPDARVSMPLAWDEVPDCDRPTSPWPPRRAVRGARRSATPRSTAPGSLDPLLELAARDEAAGPRRRAVAAALREGRARGQARGAVACRSAASFAQRAEGERRPSRGRAQRGEAERVKTAEGRARCRCSRSQNSPDKKAALAGLERWKAPHP